MVGQRQRGKFAATRQGHGKQQLVCQVSPYRGRRREITFQPFGRT